MMLTKDDEKHNKERQVDVEPMHFSWREVGMREPSH